MSSIIRDFRFGMRILLRKPLLTMAAILSLALGIGANSVIFSVVNAVMLRPLRFTDPDKLVRVWGVNHEAGANDAGLSPMNYLDYKAQTATLEQIAGYTSVGASFNLAGEEETERIQGARVTANLFEMLGVKPALGRIFVTGEDQTGHERVVVLSHAFWKRRFGGDPAIIDKPITLNGSSYTVIGVMPSDFNFMFMRDVEMFAPLAFGTRLTSVRYNPYLMIIARLKNTVSRDQAQAELVTIAGRLEQQYAEDNKGWTVEVESLNEHVIKPIRPLLLTLMGAVILVLFIACSNVANLLLIRALARQKEMGVRMAIGADRWRLVRQSLSESLLLAMLGGGVGILLAFLGLKLLVAFNPSNLPRLQEINLDSRVLIFTLAVSVLTAILFGLAPMIRIFRIEIIDALREAEGRVTGSRLARRLQSAFVISGMTLATVLLIGAGLLIKSFMQLKSVDPGFNPHNVLTMQVSTSPILFPERQDIVQFWSDAMRRVEGMPGVKAVAAASDVPVATLANRTVFTVVGQTQDNHEIEVPFHGVSHNFFQTLGIELLGGRLFTEPETQQRAPVIIINEALASKYFPDGKALGQRLSLQLAGPWAGEIVGIVKNVRHEGLTKQPQPEVYVPFLDFAQSLIVRTDKDPRALAVAVRKEITQTGKKPPAYRVRTMDEVLYDSVADPRLYMVLLSIFAVVAFILAGVGLYSLISYSVSQRTHEIGLRMALGADQRRVLRLILKQGAVLAIIGAALGLGLAFTLTRLMSKLLYGLSPTDPVTYIGVVLLLIGVALFATYFPSRKATKVEPIEALRYE
jgi:putative ABC transport system permease protein